MEKRACAVLVFLAGCQAQVDGTRPAAPDMPPAKDDSFDDPSDDPDDPTADDPADPEHEGPAPGVEREPNDDASIATPLGVPVAVAQGELAASDHDWYSVRIVERGGYVFETSTGDLSDDHATDTLVRVYAADATDEPLFFDDDSGEGFASRAAANLSPGQYLVEVTGYGGSVAGPYTLEARGPEELSGLEQPTQPLPEQDGGDGEVGGGGLVAAAEADESEQNDTVETADSMGEAPESIGADLEPGGVDNFVFAVAEAGSVTIETGRRTESAAITDTVLEVYTADGLTMLGTDDDSADDPLFSRLTVDLPAAGVYVIRVHGYSAASEGPYRAFFIR